MTSGKGVGAALLGLVLLVMTAMPSFALTPCGTGADGEGRATSTNQLVFSTFLGASGQEQGFSITCDSSGNSYVTGYTYSNGFPTTSGAYDTSHNGGEDIFVSKLSADGSKLVWSTLIGGSGDDGGCSLSIDSNGDVVVFAYTYSTDFPTTSGCYDSTSNGNADIAVVKLDASGSTLKYSSYFGGSGSEIGRGTVGPNDEIFIDGWTTSTNFPTTSGAHDTGHNGGGEDIFVSKFKSDCKSLAFSTYVGGSGSDQTYSVPVVDSDGNVYAAGMTSSSDFPVSSGCYQNARKGGEDSIALELDSDGTTLQASTYIGGSSQDNARGIALNPDGDVVVAGFSGSTDFPTTTGAFDTSSNGQWDLTASVLDPGLSKLRSSTYIGGFGEDSCTCARVDGDGIIYMTGYTESTDFPIEEEFYDDSHNGERDAYLMRLSADCTEVLNSTYMGGSGLDEGEVLDMDANYSVYLTGRVESSDFPVTSGCYDGSQNGDRDLYVLKFDFLGGTSPGNMSDRDQDGVPDSKDAFPDNPYEYIDTDGDGMGDNLDPDADSDGVPDERDAFPLDKKEWQDTDGDGTGDKADTDDDNDGVADTKDAFPKNPSEFMDSDSDGIGDNLDPDDDNDGITDEQEMLDAIKGEFTILADLLSTVQGIIQNDLAEVNQSLGATLADLGGDILDDLGGVNASLAGDIQDLMASVDADMVDLGLSVSGDVDDLQGWLDGVLTAIDLALERSNATLHARIGDVDARNAGFYQSLHTELGDAIKRLAQVEGNLSAGDEDIRADIAALSELTSDLSGHTLSELSALLDRISGEISKYDAGTAERLQTISGNLTAFADQVDRTLQDLAKLDDIIANVSQLDSDLGQARQELGTDIQDTHDEQMGRSTVNMALIVVVLVLALIVVVLLLRMRRPDMAAQKE